MLKVVHYDTVVISYQVDPLEDAEVKEESYNEVDIEEHLVYVDDLG
jgi:hypothetical protein